MPGRGASAAAASAVSVAIHPLDCASVCFWLAEPRALATRLRSMAVSVLFVCLGNICRSPLAEAAFRREAERLGLDVEIDSAGTGDWHIGHPPDPRAAAVAARNGIDIGHLRARQVTAEGFRRLHPIVGPDSDNPLGLQRPQPADAQAR